MMRCYFRKGFLGMMRPMVLSPEGAAWLLSQMLNMKDLTSELALWKDPLGDSDTLSEETLDAKMRSRINNDNWLCWGLREAVATAVSEGKGIYTLRHYSFKFIDEILYSGSDVMWGVRCDCDCGCHQHTTPIFGDVMIDEVVVLTLERSVERHLIWKASARLHGIPFEQVRFHKGADGKKFCSRQEVIDAAVADGFEDIDKFCADTYMDHSQLTKAGIATSVELSLDPAIYH